MEFNYFTMLYWFCHTSTCIHHRYTRVLHPEPPSLLPPRTIPLGHPSAPAPSIQYHALNLGWWLVSYMIYASIPTLKPSTNQGPTSSRARHTMQILQQHRNTALSSNIQAAQSSSKTIDISIITSAFSKTSLNIWKFTVHVLLKPGLENFEHYFTSMWDECNCVVVWAFFGIAFLWDWNKNWPFPVLWPLMRFPGLLAYWVLHFHGIIF